jgi:sterol 3beta-glucosyltransferase
MDFSETIEVKVFDREEPFSVDSYFFAYFHDLQHALNLIRDAVRTYRALNTQASPDLVRDTTHSRIPHPAVHAEIVRSASAPEPEAVSRNSTSAATSTSTSGFSLTSLWKPFHDSYTATRSTPADTDTEDFTHISKRASFIPSASSSREDSASSLSEASKTSDSSTRPGQAAPHTYSDHTYPPPTSPGYHVIASGDSASGSGWGVGVPSWLRGPSKRVFASPLGSGSVGLESAGPSTNSEMNQAGSGGHLHAQSDLGFSMLETPDSRIDPEILERFSTSFAFDEREMLLGCESMFRTIDLILMFNFQISPVTFSVYCPFMVVCIFQRTISRSDPAVH